MVQSRLFYLNQAFFVHFEGNLFSPKMAKLDFLPWNSIFSPENSNFRQFWANSTLQNIIWHKNLHGVTLFIAFLLSKFMGKGENLYLLALTYKILRKKLRNCFSERVKLVFKMLKLVFKMPKLVFKTPKLPSPAFHWHVMGWISHKKSLHCILKKSAYLIGYLSLFYKSGICIHI